MLQGATGDACVVADFEAADIGIRVLRKDFTSCRQDVAPGGLGVVVAAGHRFGHQYSSSSSPGDRIKPGAVVIDTGYNPVNIGDVEYTAAAQQARLITPVPGVGPTTVALLLAQTVDAAELGGQFDVLSGLPRPGADGTVDEFG